MDNEKDETRRDREIKRLGREEPASLAISIPLGLVGAGIGGAAGYFAFLWVLKMGLYGIILPGTFLGLGCGALTRRKLLPLGILCGVAAIVLGLYAQWSIPWRVEQPPFFEYVTHFHEYLTPLQIILIVLGAVFAFWFGEGREGGVWRRKHRA